MVFTTSDSAGRDQFVARVVENRFLCREHYRLVLRLDAFPPTAPGQFVQVACRDLDCNYSPEMEMDWEPGQPLPALGRELLAPLALLRRPFSLAGRRDLANGVELDLIHRIVGVGTSWLSQLRLGDTVHLLGPLGNRFTLPPPGGTALLVGGGVGIPPMLYLAQHLAGRPAVAFCGALARDLLPLTLTEPSPSHYSVEPHMLADEFARHGVGAVLCTDDGTYGFRGFVTQALEKYLGIVGSGQWAVGSGEGIVGSGQWAVGSERRGEDAAESSSSFSSSSTAHCPLPTAHYIYTCGPEPMMKRVAEIAAARGLEAQVAVERAMACGMGTCQSCVIRLHRRPDDLAGRGRDWVYKLACTDGPVFRGADLLW